MAEKVPERDKPIVIGKTDIQESEIAETIRGFDSDIQNY